MKNDPTLPFAAVLESQKKWSQSDYGLPHYPANRREACGGISKTVPDQSYTILELFTKSQTGTINQSRSPVYTDEDLPPFERMDFAERADFLNQLKVHRKEIEQEFKEQDALERERIKEEDLKKSRENDEKLRAVFKEMNDAK